jgi:putative tRNA adenosine deaminase-associated protein
VGTSLVEGSRYTTTDPGGTVSYIASAAARGSDGWTAAELELSAAADIEEVAELLRDVDPDAEVSLLFVESEETYQVILRLDQGEDLRVFGSDGAFADESRLGALLLGDLEDPAVEIDELTAAVDEPDDEDAAPAVDPDVEPVGDPDLLADLGLPAKRLLELCAREGMLPADVTLAVCRRIGCGDEMDELRET